MRTVQEILATKQKPSNLIAPASLVIEALHLLNSVNLSYLIVMDGDDYKGIFSEREYSRNVILKGRSSSNTTVQEVMATDVPPVQLTDEVEHCINMINTHKTRYLIAVDENQDMAGVITIHDLLRQVLSAKAEYFNAAWAQQLIDEDEKGVY